MAEGGYEEGILDFEEELSVDERTTKQEEENNEDVEVDTDEEDKLLEQIKNLKIAVINAREDLKLTDIDANRANSDFEVASAELAAVKKEHERLIAEKDSLLQAVQSRELLVKVNKSKFIQVQI